MGAGVNTGETLIGNIGAKSKFGYDVLGDSVSTAARLEGQTKGYGVLLIIGPNTNTIVKDEIHTYELDNIAVKGKTVGLRIYYPLTNANNYNPDESMRHNSMLAAYRNQMFDDAIELSVGLKGCHGGELDQYYDLWIERCKEMSQRNLPKVWDGIYVATSK
jgi:adenylate cyclase